MHKKPKIIFIQEVFGRLSEVFLYRMLTNMNDIDVEVLTEKHINKEDFPFDPAKIKTWRKANITSPKKALPLLRKILRSKGSYTAETDDIITQINNSDADLVCFQFASLPTLFGKEINKIEKKCCVIHHGSDVNLAVEHKAYRKRLKILWEKMDQIIFISHFLMETALGLGCPKEKSTVMFLGVPLLSKDTISQHIKQEKESIRFICIARIVPVKNHLNLVNAFADFVKATDKKVELLLIGAGELEKKIQQNIQALHMDQHIKLLGGMSNEKVLLEIAKSDCIVLISKQYTIKGKINQEEGLGLSLLEGGGMGLPMIGSRSGGIPEIVHDNINGYLVDPLNIEEIKNAMIKIVNDPVKSKSMGENARAMVETDFNLELQIKRFESMFMTIIDNHHG
ncbi:MAG: glycosyltransferase family 4 protein [Sulfurimonadaceae bacterium]